MRELGEGLQGQVDFILRRINEWDSKTGTDVKTLMVENFAPSTVPIVCMIFCNFFVATGTPIYKRQKRDDTQLESG